MGEPPKLPPRNIITAPDKTLPRPPPSAAVDSAVDAPTPLNEDYSAIPNQQILSPPISISREGERPLPTVPGKVEISDKEPKYSDTPAQSALMAGMNSTFSKELDESISFPKSSIIPEHWLASSANIRKSNDEASIKSGISKKSMDSLSPPTESSLTTQKLSEGENNKILNTTIHDASKINSSTKTEEIILKSAEPEATSNQEQNTPIKIEDLENSNSVANNQSIPQSDNLSAPSPTHPSPPAPINTTTPVPIYAGGVFLGYSTGNTPTRPAMSPHNPQMYARPRPGAMYARPAAENIPLGLQYRPADVRPRPVFRPGYRPRPNIIVRPGMEQYRPDYRPGPGMEGFRPMSVYRPRPNLDSNYRPALPGMYSRPLPARPYHGGSQYGGSQVSYQSGSEVGYQGGPPLNRRTSQMEVIQANHQAGPARRTSLLDHNRYGVNSVTNSPHRSTDDNQSVVSTPEQGYRQSIPVFFDESNNGPHNMARPFDPSRVLYRGPPILQSPDAVYRQSFRPSPQRSASYHYPQGYYRPSQTASFHSTDSNSVQSASIRPRPSPMSSEVGVRTSSEPDLDSPRSKPESVEKNSNAEAEANPSSLAKDSPSSPAEKLAIGEMTLEPEPIPVPAVPLLPLPDAGGGYRNNSLNFTAPKQERKRSFEKVPHDGHLLIVQEGPVLSRRSSLDDGTLTRKGKKVQVEESDMDSDVSSSVAASAVDSTVHSDMRPTFVTISRPRRDAGSRWVDPVELLNEQRIVSNASKDPKVHFEFAKACLSNGEPYIDEGFSILRRLATSGYPEAHFFLGEAFADDGKDALAYAQFLSAAKRGFAPACFAVGTCAEEGKGCKKNMRLALEMYSKAATAGNLQAMYRLGKAELEGTLGMKKDPVKATKWFKRAAAVPNREHPEPLYELAVIYETGVPPYIMQDFAYARGVLQEAADFGYPPAIYKLGYCYEHGLMGYDVNPAESIRLYSEAVELGNTEALLGMAGWHMTGADTLLPQNQEMAFHLVKEAADRELARAEYTLGYFYEGGIGTYINMDLAFKYYELAAAQGEERAIARIKKANPNSIISTKKDKKRSFFGGLFGKK